MVLSVFGDTNFTAPSVVGSRIYNVLCVRLSGAISALSMWNPGRERLRTRAWQRREKERKRDNRKMVNVSEALDVDKILKYSGFDESS